MKRSGYFSTRQCAGWGFENTGEHLKRGVLPQTFCRKSPLKNRLPGRKVTWHRWTFTLLRPCIGKEGDLPVTTAPAPFSCFKVIAIFFRATPMPVRLIISDDGCQGYRPPLTRPSHTRCVAKVQWVFVLEVLQSGGILPQSCWENKMRLRGTIATIF